MKSEGTGAGLNFPSSLARRGVKEAFGTRLFFAQNMGGGVIESSSISGQKGEGGCFNLLLSVWQEGRGRGDARLFLFDGGRGSM